MLNTLVLIAAALPTLLAAHGDAIDAYVRSELAARRLPGVALAVVKDGRIVKTAGYGLASLELDAPVTERTVFEIGSISKQIAATPSCCWSRTASSRSTIRSRNTSRATAPAPE